MVLKNPVFGVQKIINLYRKIYEMAVHFINCLWNGERYRHCERVNNRDTIFVSRRYSLNIVLPKLRRNYTLNMFLWAITTNKATEKKQRSNVAANSRISRELISETAFLWLWQAWTLVEEDLPRHSISSEGGEERDLYRVATTDKTNTSFILKTVNMVRHF